MSHERYVRVGGKAARVRLPAASWMPLVVPMPGYRDAAGSDLSSVAAGRLRLPQEFAQPLYPLLVPGTTLLLTDAPVLEETSGSKLTVISSGVPN
jgi:hypothetical protein